MKPIGRYCAMRSHDADEKLISRSSRRVARTIERGSVGSSPPPLRRKSMIKASALARKDQPQAVASPEPAAAPPASAIKATDSRIATTLRIEPERLEALKILAAKRRVRVNDLILEGVDHVLALNAVAH